MRLTGSGVYSRAAPVPKMPAGLVELMEGLTKEVLKNNPSNIYEFCADHMKELILIRDGRAPKQHFTLEQKIKRAQDKMREKAEERRRKYDDEMKRYGIVAPQTSASVHEIIVFPEVKEQSTGGNLSDQLKIEESVESKIKTPIHHEKDLTDALEVEIFHKPLKEAANIIDGPSSTTFYLPQDETTQLKESMKNVDNSKECEEPIVVKSVDTVLDDNLVVNVESTISNTTGIIDNNESSLGANVIEDDKELPPEHVRTRRSVVSEGKENDLEHSSEFLEIEETNQQNAQTTDTAEDIADKNVERTDKTIDTQNEDENESNTTENASNKHLINDHVSSLSDGAILEETKDNFSEEVQDLNTVSVDAIPSEVDLKDLVVTEEQLNNEEADKQVIKDQLVEDLKEIEVFPVPISDTVDIAVVTANAVDTATKFAENIDEQVLSVDEPTENKSIIKTNESDDDICNELKEIYTSECTEEKVLTTEPTFSINANNDIICNEDADCNTDRTNANEIVDEKLPEQETVSSRKVEPIDQKSEHITEGTRDETKFDDNEQTLNTDVVIQSLNDAQNLELVEVIKEPETENVVSESVIQPEISIAASTTKESPDMTKPILEETITYESNGNDFKAESESTTIAEHDVIDSDSIQENNNEADDALTTIDKILVIESAAKDDNESVPEQFIDTDLNAGNVNGKHLNNGSIENGSESPELLNYDANDELPFETSNADIPNTENDSYDVQSEISELKKTDDNSDCVGKSSSMDDNITEGTTTSILEAGGTKYSSDLAANKHTQSSMDLETAAITIQKVFRSFLFKRGSTFDDTGIENNSMEDDNKVEVDFPVNATVLNKERRTLGISRMDTVLQTVNEEKSLSLSTDDSSLSSAATIIQAHVRGFLVRNRLNSHKTNSTSLVNSDAPSTSLDGDVEQKANKTVLNIHIVPEGEHFLSRDESLLTSIDLSLDGSPPSSTNLHPLGYDKSEPRKQLKREDAIQSISPPSNNSGKLSEDVDSVKDMLVSDSEQQKIIAGIMNEPCQDADLESRDDTPTRSTTIETVIEAHKIVRDSSNSLEQDVEKPVSDEYCKQPLTKLESDENDVITPFEEKTQTPSNSDDTLRLVHSGEFHDVVLPTKISRTDTSVVRGE